MVEGQRTLDVGNRTEIDAEPILSTSNQVIKIGKLGTERGRTRKRISSSSGSAASFTEGRLPVHRRISSQFAQVATLTPQLYVNPNEAICHGAGMQMLAKADSVPKHLNDANADKVSSSSSSGRHMDDPDPPSASHSD